MSEQTLQTFLDVPDEHSRLHPEYKFRVQTASELSVRSHTQRLVPSGKRGSKRSKTEPSI